MNILFLNLLAFSSFEEKNIYADILREMIYKGHNVFAVCPTERRNNEKTYIQHFGNSSILHVKTLNIQKTNIVEKGLGTLLIKNQFIRAIKKHYKNIPFDLILYPTPPITLYGVVNYFKNKYNAKTYLMLKDIFPQNAVDLGMMKKTGIKGIIYRFFRKKEKKLYLVSDAIGCMSQANVDYVVEHNPELANKRIEVFPNCMEVKTIVPLSKEEKESTRLKYGIPYDKKVFVYGGNLGKPQDIPYVIECLKAVKDNANAFFVIAGNGTDYSKLLDFYKKNNQTNFLLLERLPSGEFDSLISACDVGLVFLDHRFTIPNFPSRLLSYMQASLPVLACTDTSSDIGKTIVEGGFGWWCESNDTCAFKQVIDGICNEDLSQKRINSFEYLKKNFNIDNVSKILGDD